MSRSAAPQGRSLRIGVWLPTLVALGVIAGLWQLYAVHNPYVLPTVPAVFERLGTAPGLFVKDTATTLEEVVVGGAIGFAGAFLVAVIMSEVPLVARAVMPLAVALTVTPVVAIAPALSLIVGVSMVPRFLVAGIVVFFPVLVSTLVGLRAADPAVLEVARSLDASRLELLWRIRLPSSLPHLFAGARIGLPLALVGAVVAEFTTTSSAGGLGVLIDVAQGQDDLPTIFAAILLLAVIGIALTLVVVLLERRLLSWHRAGRPTGR